MSLQLYISYIPSWKALKLHNISLRLLRSVNSLTSKLKFKTILINKSQLLLKGLYLEATLTFLRFAAKHCSIAQLFGGLISYTQLYVAHSKLCRGKLFNGKRKPHTMSEKRHEINKFANYQKYNSEKQSHLGPPCFCSFSKPLIYDFWRNAHDQYTSPLARPLLIALQVVRTSFGFHLRECTGSSFPPCLI